LAGSRTNCHDGRFCRLCRLVSSRCRRRRSWQDPTGTGGAREEWKAGFEATAKGLQSVRLDFRFSQRIDDAESAHETGIFRYERSGANNDDEAPTTTTIRFVDFEALMIKKDGRWVWLMEYQKGNASQADWDALAPAMAADESR
jgi:hypothetical protein